MAPRLFGARRTGDARLQQRREQRSRPDVEVGAGRREPPERLVRERRVGEHGGGAQQGVDRQEDEEPPGPGCRLERRATATSHRLWRAHCDVQFGT